DSQGPRGGRDAPSSRARRAARGQPGTPAARASRRRRRRVLLQHATKNLHKHDPSGARQRRRRRGGAAPMQEIHADLRKSGLTQTTSRREGSC
ncbi:unnamed protein product, partial [Prorocentrum cordatum]